MVLVMGELDGGVVANHLVNWLSPLKERSTVVTGERGAFVADTLTADLSFYANGRCDRVGGHHRVPRRLRGRHDALRDPEEGAAAGRARAVPRRCPAGSVDGVDIVSLEQGLRSSRWRRRSLQSAQGAAVRL